MTSPLPRSRALLALCSFGALSLGACRETFTDVSFDDWSPEVAVPLLNTSFTLEEALANAEFGGRLDEDSTGRLRVRIERDFFDVAPGEVLDFERVVLPLVDTSAAYTPQELEVPYGVTRVLLDAGTVTANLINDRPVPLEVTVRIPGVVADGSPYERAFAVAPLSAATDVLPVDAVEVAVDADGVFAVEYTALTPTGERVVAGPGAVVIETAGYTYAEGTFAGLEVDLTRDSIPLDVLEAFEPGTVELVDPSIAIAIENETRVPLLVSAPEAFVQGRDGEPIAIESDLAAGTLVRGAGPADSFATTVVRIDPTNSNLDDAVNGFPEALVFALRGGADAREGDDGAFAVHRSARLRGTLAFEAPLSARFRAFRLREDFEFDASALGEATSARFNLIIASDYGLAVDAQVYFYDGTGATIDSLFAAPERVVDAEPADRVGGGTDLALVGPAVKQTSIPLTPRQVDELAATRRASVLLRVTSPAGGDEETTLYADDLMSVQLGVVVGVDPETLSE